MALAPPFVQSSLGVAFSAENRHSSRIKSAFTRVCDALCPDRLFPEDAPETLMRFRTLDDLRAACRDLPPGNLEAAAAAAARQATLTKPVGSLGRLEELVVWLARWQGRALPELERVSVLVFAGNHGVTGHGVSAYPQAVTKQMVANFAAGGAAINQIARLAVAELTVVPIELDRPTADFTLAPAMDVDEFLGALDTGYRTVPADGDL